MLGVEAPSTSQQTAIVAYPAGCQLPAGTSPRLHRAVRAVSNFVQTAPVNERIL
jgi:hypothetical protein